MDKEEQKRVREENKRIKHLADENNRREARRIARLEEERKVHVRALVQAFGAEGAKLRLSQLVDLIVEEKGR